MVRFCLPSGRGVVSKNSGIFNFLLDTTPLPDGRQNLTINATDYLNNTNNSEFVAVTVDNSPPSLSFLNPLHLQNRSRTINITIVGTDTTTGIKTLQVQNGTNGNWIPLELSAGTINSGNWSVLFNTTSVSDGYLNLTINATDYAGNSNSSELITIIVDNTHPKIFKYNGNVVNNAILRGNITLNVTANDTVTG